MTSARLLFSRALVVGLVASLGAVCSTRPASAEPTWVPPVDIATEIPVVNWYDVDHLPDDTTAVVWGEESADGDGTVYFATRGLGAAAFSSAEPLSGGYAWNPQIVVDAQGAVIVAWIQVANGQSVQVTRLEPGATDWSTPDIVSSHSTRDFQLLVDQAGTVTVLSRHEVLSPGDGPDTYRVDANARPDGGEWSGPQVVAEESTRQISDLRAVVDEGGRVTAVWVETDAVVSGVRFAVSDAGGFIVAWLSTEHVGAAAPDVAAIPGGGAAVSWAQDESPGIDVTMLATSGPEAPDFTAAEPVTDPQGEVLDTEVVVDPDGTATVLSTVRSFGEDAVVASTRAGDDLFVSQLLDSTSGEVLGQLEAAAGPGGGLTAVWQLADDGSLPRVHTAHRVPGADFGPSIDLAPLDDPDTTDDDAAQLEPAVAVDSSGDATVVWLAYRRQTSAIRSRVLDVAGPIVGHVAVPTAATAGNEVGMVVAAADHWSGPPAVEWSFGDGASSTGTATSHTYAAAGTYQVTVTATDAVGNSSILTRELTVAAPPPTPPSPPVSDRVAPVLSNARITPKTLSAHRPAKVRVTSSEAATLVAVVQRLTNKRWTRQARRQWVVEIGANTEKLYGKPAQQRLRTGRYRVRLTATDPGGNASATTTIRFRVARG